MLKKIKSVVLCFSLIFVIASMAVYFTGCSDSLDKKLTAHEWVTTELKDPITYTFFENGTYSMSRSWSYGGVRDSENGTWEINGTDLFLSQANKSFAFKNIEGELSANSFSADEWYVSDRFLYLKGNEFVGQN